MAYVGNPVDTQNTFQSLQGKRFSGDGSTTAFTLDVAPSSTLDIEVFVGNVRQDPNSAYTLSGTTLTFTGAPPSGTNNIYVVHQAKSVGTIDVPALGVSTASIQADAITEAKIADDAVESEHLNDNIISGQTELAATPADTDEFLVSDGGTLKRVDYSYIKAEDNTPMFAVSKSSSQNIGQNTTTKITFDNEYIDTDNAFASNKFTCPSGGAGNYSMTMSILFHKLNTTYLKGIEIAVYKNGAPLNYGNDLGEANFGFIADATQFTQVQGITTFIVTLAENDYVECYGKAIPSDGNDTQVYNYFTHWTGHKLIT